MAGPTPLNQSQYLGQNVKNAMIPKEGPQAVPLSLPFNTGTAFTIDLTLQQIRKYVSIIQCLFIDNSGNAAPLSLFVSVVNQNLICPPNSQMYVPILVPTNAILTATCTGGVAATVDLINVPLPFGIWPANTYIPTFGAGGAMLVIDSLAESYLAQIVTNTAGGGGTGANEVTGYNDILRPWFLGGRAYTQKVSASGSTTLNQVGSGSNNQSLFMTHCHVSISGDATLAAAGELVVKVQDFDGAGVNVVIAEATVSLPASGSPGTGISQRLISWNNMNYLSEIPSDGVHRNNFNINLSAALTSGFVDCSILAGITSFHAQ